MTLGEGIFYSSLFLGVIGLYIATKDRWRWKRIVLWPLGLIALVAIGGGIFAYVESLPTVQTEFLGISLGDTKADVKFKKGAPGEETEDSWAYAFPSQTDGDIYVVDFKGDDVQSITYSGNDGFYGPRIQGIRPNERSAEIVERYGDPSRLCVSDDGLERRYEYDEYNVFFGFKTDKLDYFGVYRSDYGSVYRCGIQDYKRELLELEEERARRKERARAMMLRQHQHQDAPP